MKLSCNDFEKYEYLINHVIKRDCPDLLGDEDLYQELALVMLERASTEKEIGHPYQYYYYLLRHHLKDYTRKINSLDNIRLSEANDIEIHTIDEIDDRIYSEEFKDIVARLLNTLTPREAEVILYRFYFNYTLERVGIKLNVSRDRARQIEAKALRKLRHPSRKRYLETDNDGKFEPVSERSPSCSNVSFYHKVIEMTSELV